MGDFPNHQIFFLKWGACYIGGRGGYYQFATPPTIGGSTWSPITIKKQNKMSQTKIQGEDVLLVQQVSNDLPYDLKSKMAGQNYRRFAFGGKVFISSDASFYTALANGDVHTISVAVNEEGKLSMTGFITYTRMQGLRKNQIVLDSITVENYRAVALTNPEDAIA